MKSHKFYKGDIITDAASVGFLSKSAVEKGLNEPKNQNNQESLSVWQRMFAAKKAFFITYAFLVLNSALWMCPMFVTLIFSKTGSTLSEKNSSLIVSITMLITNLVFLNCVERFNRKVSPNR